MHSEFWLFELSVWLHVFARALIAVFIPVLFLLNGLEIGDVMIFFFIFLLIDLPLGFFVKYLLPKIGARWVVIIGSLASIVFFAIFYSLNFTWSTLFALAVFAAIHDAFYWIGYLYLFMQSTKNKKGKKRNSSKSTSILYIVRTIAGILAPIAGALILIFISQKLLILVSAGILALSIWPLYKMKHVHDKPKIKTKPFKVFFKDIREKKNYASMMIWGIQGSAESVIWPLFIYVIFGTLESVAYLPVIVAVTTMIITYFAGNIKKGDRSKMIALGAGLVALTWILRLTIQADIMLYVTVFLIGLFSVLVLVPLDSDIFERGAKIDALSASTYRNTFAIIFKVILYGVLALLVNVFNISFVVATISLFVLMGLNLLFISRTQLSSQKL